jgi:hypothetical protein
MSFYAYHGLELIPYHSQKFANLWFYPENPTELGIYNSQLSNNNYHEMEFNKIGCPTHCEICFDLNSCEVCKPWFFKKPDGSCIYDEGLSVGLYSPMGRSYIKNIDSTTSAEKINFDYSGNKSFLAVWIEVDKDGNTLISTDKKYCEIKNENNEVLTDFINWKFNNCPISPYYEYYIVAGNYKQLLKIDVTKNIAQISPGDCALLYNFESSFHSGECLTEYFTSESLKGYLALKFCDNAYINISNLDNMIFPEKTVDIKNNEYKIPIPGTTSFAYGKCKNNCRCWDRDINTEKGYNSCFPHPDTGEICPDGFGLLNFSLDESRQGCVSNAFLDTFQLVIETTTCDPNCSVCNGNNECTKCVDSNFNRNYISEFSDALYCGTCHSSCFSCSGPNEADCLCQKFDPVMKTTLFESNFNLCRAKVLCSENCVSCGLEGCKECRSGYYFNIAEDKCKPKLSRKCQFYDPEKECITCPINRFFRNQACLKCPLNCQFCFFGICSVCSDGFILINGSCVSMLSKTFLKNNYSDFEKNVYPASVSLSIKNIQNQIKYFKLFKKEVFSMEELHKIYELEKDYFVDKVALNEYIHLNSENCEESKKNDPFFFEICNSGPSNIVLFDDVLKLNFSTLCDNNISNCVDCKSQKICSKCKENFLWDPTTKVCVNLNSMNITQARVSSNSNKITPIRCVENYYLNSKFKKCKKIISKCIKMNPKGTCKKCLPGFAPNYSQTECMKCSTYCFKCHSASLCLECESNFYLAISSGKIIIQIMYRNKQFQMYGVSKKLPHLFF